MMSSQVKMEEMRLRQREKRQEEMRRKRSGGAGEDSVAMETVEERPRNVLSAPQLESEETQEPEDEAADLRRAGLGQNSRRAFLRELRKVVSGADVVLHVLDARDPEGTRSKAIEDMVLQTAGKRLVFVLNKADLVPREVLRGWLTHLRQFHPAVPFKCNTQTQRSNLGMSAGRVAKVEEKGLQTSQAVGAEELLGLLKNYCRVGADAKSIITVGCVGFPNGKSPSYSP